MCGLAGASSGADAATTQYSYSSKSCCTGAAPYFNGVGTNGHDGTQADIASGLISSNYLSNNGTGLVNFTISALTNSITANDGIHWTSGAYSTVGDQIAAALVAAGIVPNCGGIPVPAPRTNSHLRNYNGFVYDPVDHLPLPVTDLYIHILSGGSDWAADIGTHQITGGFSFTTPSDGDQVLYNPIELVGTTTLQYATYTLDSTP